MNDPVTLEFDGGSRGNPGPAGIGVVLRAADGTSLLTLGRFIGRATNNVAEYSALIAGLELAAGMGIRRLRVRGDSELIIRQMQGSYRVKHPDLRPLYERASDLVGQFDQVEFEHGRRHKNRLADRLANLAMDRRTEITEIDENESAEPETSPAPKAGDHYACPRCGCSIEVRTPSRLYPHQLRPFICQCGAKMG